ncbi:MAG: hypothetical protein FWF87_05485 [Synergistaceae bacterium]|nr:hypothetical protein [Synergistaceae bacterium]
MEKGFLQRYANRVIKKTKMLFAMLGVLMIAALTGLYFVGIAAEEDLLFSSPLIPGIIGVMLFIIIGACIVLTIQNRRWANYGGLTVQGEATKEEAGRVIDDEAASGNILVDEYIYSNKTGTRFVLTPSYLLICEGMKVTAIPAGKIFWICAQAGIKGESDYIVRMKIFAENKMYDVVGANIEHLKNIADKMYRYIPNIFSNYDAFDLSYKLQEIFVKDYSQFLAIYQEQKQQFYASNASTE